MLGVLMLLSEILDFMGDMGWLRKRRVLKTIYILAILAMLGAGIYAAMWIIDVGREYHIWEQHQPHRF